MKTRWINILQPLKLIKKRMNMIYKLIINIVIDGGFVELIKSNLLNFHDIDIVTNVNDMEFISFECSFMTCSELVPNSRFSFSSLSINF